MDADNTPPQQLEQSTRLITDLEQELLAYQVLRDILTEEKTLLTSRDFDSFTRLLGKKHTQLTILEAFNKRRCELLEAKDLTVDKVGINLLFASFAADESVKSRSIWTQINNLIDACNTLNDINARIAHRAQTTTHQVLNILHGQSAGFELYGKNGTSKDRASRLAITKV